MAKKLFVKTHGCQMNEYDSARMYDVLRETQGMSGQTARTMRCVVAKYLLDRSQEKVFHQLGRAKAKNRPA